MTRIIKSIAFPALLVVFILASCSKDLTERNQQFGQLNPVQTDSLAGTWKTLLLTSPDEFLIPAPAPVNAAYTREINEIKSYQANLTQSQKNSIQYWSAGGVLRWNEIMRTLVARHNLPPYQNQDGTYPAPSAANPFAYPQFPFSNPPFAARAYAYISAAQYDALVAAWYYKKLYRRKAPYAVDSTLQVLVPKSSLSAYPSEDAVLAGVTVEMMKLLFPTEIAYVQQMADEQMQARIMSGANVRSDIDAGENLGKQIAQKFIARAASDRAGAAIGNPTIWAQLETDCIARGEAPWKTLELPTRPPMLPLFGKVKSFLMDSAAVVANRAPAPPSVGTPAFQAELAEIKTMANNPTRERTAISQYWADGVGTYTPPGHWNAIAAEDFVKQNFSEVRWARNMALLNLTMMDAAIACWDAKYTYFNPRPSQVDPTIKTLTGVPNFPAYVSGHSTFSAAAAAFLGHVIPARAQAYAAMATEASNSRMYGAIHYKSDCVQGLALGNRVASFVIQRAMTDGAE